VSTRIRTVRDLLDHTYPYDMYGVCVHIASIHDETVFSSKGRLTNTMTDAQTCVDETAT